MWESHLYTKHHAHKIPVWQKIVFPIWIWKTFIHAKHEAFEFKYDPESIKILEQSHMGIIGFYLYFFTIIYYAIMFICPFIFVSHECAVGLSHEALWIYGIYALVTAVWEVYTVLKIQRTIKKKEILEFNRWHAMELLMGQVARFDTYLDMCFFSLVYQCDMWNLVTPILFFIIIMQLYPVFTMLSLCCVNHSLAHT